MVEVKLTIERGLRLHFWLDVGYEGRWLPIRLNNKELMMLHLIKDLKWRVKFDDHPGDERNFYWDNIVLEAVDVSEDIVNALKVLMRVRGMRRAEVERLKSMPLREACREIIVKNLVEG